MFGLITVLLPATRLSQLTQMNHTHTNWNKYTDYMVCFTLYIVQKYLGNKYSNCTFKIQSARGVWHLQYFSML